MEMVNIRCGLLCRIFVNDTTFVVQRKTRLQIAMQFIIVLHISGACIFGKSQIVNHIVILHLFHVLPIVNMAVVKDYHYVVYLCFCGKYLALRRRGSSHEFKMSVTVNVT